MHRTKVPGSGRNFVKGTVPNPTGRPSLPPEIRAAQKLNRVELARLLIDWMSQPIEKLRERFKDKDTPALEMMVISIIISSVRRGDSAKLNFLLDRTTGKVKENIEISGEVSVHSTLQVTHTASLSDFELKERLKLVLDSPTIDV